MTPDGSLEAVVTRLNRVEREVRWWRYVGAVLMSGFILAPMAQEALSKNRTVEAERLVIRDEGGSVRAVFGIGIGSSSRGESVGLRLTAKDGVSRAEFFLDVDGTPFLRLGARDGQAALQADVSPNDIPGFVLWGKRTGAEGPRAATLVTFGNDGLPTVRLADQRGKIIWSVP
jgi:hypothetical protein